MFINASESDYKNFSNNSKVSVHFRGDGVFIISMIFEIVPGALFYFLIISAKWEIEEFQK